MSKAKKTYQKGIWAEQLAAWFLRLKGYRILEERFKTPFGEIDLIARKGQSIICVEVKYRHDQESGLEAVQPRSQQRITKAADVFRGQNSVYQDYAVQFDIIIFSPPFSLRHHKNAWYDSFP